MSHDLVKTIEYRGKKINVYYDRDADSPSAWGDEGLFLVAYHRDFTVREDKVVTREELIDATEDINHPLRKRYHLLDLEAYIHSGVVLALRGEGNFPDRQWDVSYLGAVLVSKAEWEERAEARRAAKGLIETWNEYLSGDVYGFKVEFDDYEDSCWGYYGQKGMDEMIAEAKGGIDNYLNAKIKSHIKRRKAQIVHKVPLSKREELKIE